MSQKTEIGDGRAKRRGEETGQIGRIASTTGSRKLHNLMLLQLSRSCRVCLSSEMLNRRSAVFVVNSGADSLQTGGQEERRLPAGGR